MTLQGPGPFQAGSQARNSTCKSFREVACRPVVDSRARDAVVYRNRAQPAGGILEPRAQAAGDVYRPAGLSCRSPIVCAGRTLDLITLRES